MKLILEIGGQGDDDPVQHRVANGFPVTVGRGYDNDIILSDPHVGDRHFSIDRDDKGFVLTDLGSVNATSVNGRLCRGGATHIVSGDTIRAGLVSIRVFAPEHAVEPAVRLHKAPPVVVWLTRPLNVWAFFLLAVALVSAWAYGGVWTEDAGLVLTAAGAAATIVVFVWAALWAVAGRIVRRTTRFMGHVALISLFLCLGAGISWLSSAVAFLLSEGLFTVLFGYALNAALLTMLLYGSLSLATHMKKRRRLMSAAFFSFGLALGIFSVGLITMGKFSPDALYPYRLHPFLGKYAPAETAEGFMKDSAKLFKSDTFDRKKDKKDKD